MPVHASLKHRVTKRDQWNAKTKINNTIQPFMFFLTINLIVTEQKPVQFLPCEGNV